MGLFTGLLTLPLAPVRGVTWVAEQVLEEVERQYYDESAIRRELMQVELDFEDKKIDEHERARLEEELFERLAIGQAHREEPYG